MDKRWTLPNSWKWVEAKAIAKIVGGGTPPAGDTSNFAGEDGVPWITPADLTGYEGTYIARGRRNLSKKGLASSGATLMPERTVLYSSRAPIGYCAIAASPISTNQGFKSLVLNEGILPEFIRYYLLSSKEYAEGLASGTTFKELSGSRMALLPIPLAPKEEQRRIVAKLDRLTARSRNARDELAHIPKLVERYKQAVLKRAIDAELTFNIYSSQSDTAWRPVRAGELISWASGKSLPKKTQKSGAVPVYGGNGVQGHHDVALVQSPTIVIGRVGARCGNVYLTSGPAWVTDNAIYTSEISASLLPEFACLIFENVNLNALSGGSGQPYVSQTLLNGVEFRLPPLQEQRLICDLIKEHATRIGEIEAQSARAQNLIRRLDYSILAKAFRGDLVTLAAASIEPSSRMAAPA